MTAIARVLQPRSAVASLHRSTFARTLLLCLTLLAASPYHAPFSTFKQGHQGHVYSHVAFSQTASALKMAHERRFASGFASPDLSAAACGIHAPGGDHAPEAARLAGPGPIPRHKRRHYQVRDVIVTI